MEESPHRQPLPFGQTWSGVVGHWLAVPYTVRFFRLFFNNQNYTKLTTDPDSDGATSVVMSPSSIRTEARRLRLVVPY